MDIKILINYALIKSFYEEKRDYIDIFVPFLLKVLINENKPLKIETIQTDFKNLFDMDIPIYTLNTIISRAKKLEYISMQNEYYNIEEKGKKFILEKFKSEDEMNRKTNSLIDDIIIFINKKYCINFNNNDILNILQSFFKKNSIFLIEFFYSNSIQHKSDTTLNVNERYIIEYFDYAKDRNEYFYNILSDIFNGSLISTLLYYEDINKINQKFKDLTIYLDTNFMFSIMGFRYQPFVKPAIELFNLLKKYKFKLKIFQFTLSEMKRYLFNYDPSSYIGSIKVDDIYCVLKSKNWTIEDCYNYIAKIDKKITDLGVEIEYIELDPQKIENYEKIHKALESYKFNINIEEPKTFSIYHDIAAIEAIRKIRKTSCGNLENSKAIFLTSDMRLSKFNYIEMGHKDYKTCPEVITDRFLTNYLWLKNPDFKNSLPLNATLSLYSEILIDRRIWNRFVNNLKNLREVGEVTDEDIGNLIYYHRIEEDLGVKKNPEQISNDFILDEIVTVKKENTKVREDYEEEIKKLTKEIKEEGKKIKEYEEFNKRKRGEIKEFLQKIEKEKEKMRKKADKNASYIVIGFTIIILILLVLISYILHSFYPSLAAIIIFIFKLCDFLGIKFNFMGNLSKVTKTKISNKLYKKYTNKKDETINEKLIDILKQL